MASLNAKRAEAIQRAKADADSLTRDEVAAALGVQPSAVDHYLRKGYLPAVRIEDIPGQPATLVSTRRTWSSSGASGETAMPGASVGSGSTLTTT